MKNKITGWHDLPIGKFQEILALENRSCKASCLAILEDVPLDDLLKQTVKAIAILYKPYEFINIECKGKMPVKEYLIGPRTYSVLLDVDQMTTGQFIDYDAHSKNKSVTLAELASCFMIPKGTVYGDVNAKEIIKELHDNMHVQVYYDILFFFTQALQIYALATLVSSQKAVTKKVMKEIWKERINKVKRIVTLGNGSHG